MRRSLAASLLCLLALGGMASARAATQQRAPVVDVAEIAGAIDRPIERFALERIAAAEREGVALLVFQVDGGGLLKISDRAEVLPRLVRRVRDARVPIAVHIGPRTARAAGGAVYLLAAATVASVGPSATIGPAHPVDHGSAGAWSAERESEVLRALARSRGRRITGDDSAVRGANAALAAGFVDHVVPRLDELLRRLDGKTVRTAAGAVTLRLPEDGTVVRFHQPGPIRRFLHTLASPLLVYALLLAAAMLLTFEVFQRGFGVAGVTGMLAATGAGYGITVLPLRVGGLLLLAGGLGLLALDVAADRLGAATLAGTGALAVGSSVFLPPALGVPVWLVVVATGSSLAFFGPVMTVVRRAQVPIAATVRRGLVGEIGQVRSVLNPEGFVWVDGELWRARTEDGRRMRVGEAVLVSGVEGSVLLVRAAG